MKTQVLSEKCNAKQEPPPKTKQKEKEDEKTQNESTFDYEAKSPG